MTTGLNARIVDRARGYITGVGDDDNYTLTTANAGQIILASACMDDDDEFRTGNSHSIVYRARGATSFVALPTSSFGTVPYVDFSNTTISNGSNVTNANRRANSTYNPSGNGFRASGKEFVTSQSHNYGTRCRDHNTEMQVAINFSNCGSSTTWEFQTVWEDDDGATTNVSCPSITTVAATATRVVAGTASIGTVSVTQSVVNSDLYHAYYADIVPLGTVDSSVTATVIETLRDAASSASIGTASPSVTVTVTSDAVVAGTASIGTVAGAATINSAKVTRDAASSASIGTAAATITIDSITETSSVVDTASIGTVAGAATINSAKVTRDAASSASIATVGLAPVLVTATRVTSTIGEATSIGTVEGAATINSAKVTRDAASSASIGTVAPAVIVGTTSDAVVAGVALIGTVEGAAAISSITGQSAPGGTASIGTVTPVAIVGTTSDAVVASTASVGTVEGAATINSAKVTRDAASSASIGTVSPAVIVGTSSDAVVAGVASIGTLAVGPSLGLSLVSTSRLTRDVAGVASIGTVEGAATLVVNSGSSFPAGVASIGTVSPAVIVGTTSDAVVASTASIGTVSPAVIVLTTSDAVVTGTASIATVGLGPVLVTATRATSNVGEPASVGTVEGAATVSSAKVTRDAASSASVGTVTPAVDVGSTGGGVNVPVSAAASIGTVSPAVIVDSISDVLVTGAASVGTVAVAPGLGHNYGIVVSRATRSVAVSVSVGGVGALIDLVIVPPVGVAGTAAIGSLSIVIAVDSLTGISDLAPSASIGEVTVSVTTNSAPVIQSVSGTASIGSVSAGGSISAALWREVVGSASTGGVASAIWVDSATYLISVTIDGVGSLTENLLKRSVIVSVEEIWNIGLTQLGVGRVDSAVNDNSAQAELLRDIWPNFRKQFISDHAWNGCKTTAALTAYPDSDFKDTTRWATIYSLPSDYIRALTVNGHKNQPSNSESVMWEIEAVANDSGVKSRCLCSNQSSAKLEYVFDVGDANTDLLAPAMKHAMGIALGAFVAPNFGKSANEIALMEQKVKEALLRAKGVDGQENSARYFSPSELVESRYRSL